MVRLLWRKMLRDMRRSRATYMLCVIIVAIGFWGYSVLELSYQNLDESSEYFFQVTNFCDGFAEVEEAPEAVTKRLEQIDGVALAEGRLVKTIKVSGYENDVDLQMVSIRPGGMNQPMLSRGSLPESYGGYQLVVGDPIAKARQIRPGDRLTVMVEGKKSSLEVSGCGITPEHIYMVKDMGDLFPDPSTYDAGFMDYEVMSALYSKTGLVNSFLFRLEPGASWKDVKEEIEQVLTPYGCYRLYEREEHLSVNMLLEEMNQLERMSSVIPALFLSVALVILSITLSRLVEQQRTQIGTLLAMGIPMRHIQIHYMAYGVAVGLAGGILGGAAGYLSADPMADFYRVYFNLPSAAAPVSWRYLMTGTALAGMFCGAVSWVIAGTFGDLMPAVALRPPAPRAARRSVLEKIPGFTRLFTVPGMMAVRSIARNRKRAALSLGGMACAYMITASLVSMNTLFDVFIFDFWEDTQRQDIIVQFNRPVNQKDAMDGIRHPDIQMAEGVVELPVRLRGPEGEIECTVQGISQESALCRLYDEEGKTVQVQDQGIVLSRHMANVLDVEAGDSIEVKVSYPKERISRVEVTGIISQYMGSTAYMSYGGVGKISDYRNVYTSVLLKAPLQVREEILERLEEASAVSLVEDKQAKLDSFRKVMGNMSGIMAIMCTMGVMVGSVVIYVSSLISFEELKREIATLMALGLRDSQCLDVISTSQWILAAGGMLLGIPMTMGVSRWMSSAMASELFTIPDFVDGTALLQAVFLTCLSVWFSSRMILRKMKKLSPVELLRERE